MAVYLSKMVATMVGSSGNVYFVAADFEGRIKKHLEDKLKNCGCLPYFYVVLSSTGEVVKDDITNLGRAGPPIKKHQAGVKDRQYYINMFQYRFPDTQQVDTIVKIKNNLDTQKMLYTVNFLNIRTPKKFVVITLKFELCGSTIE